MRKQLPKIALIATFGLVMAFPFSCALEDTNGDSSSSGGGVGPGPSAPSGNPGGSSSSGPYQPGWDYEAYIATWEKYNMNSPSYPDTEEEGEGSKCYSNNAANCTKFGRLYNWAAAMDLPQKCNTTLSANDPDCKINNPHQGLCNPGQHIPTKTEWEKLITSAGGIDVAGEKLKSSGDWPTDKKCNGTDDFLFTAKPGGYGLSDGTFKDAGAGTMFCLPGTSYAYKARWWSASERNARNASDIYISNLNQENVSLTEAEKSYFLSVRCLDD
jgi:uncharacterized protein (TIGR02145 family)